MKVSHGDFSDTKKVQKHVYPKKNGLYFQRRGWPTIKLQSEAGTAELRDEVAAILRSPPPVPMPQPKPGQLAFGPEHSKALETSARKRAVRMARDYGLPEGWVDEQIRRQRGRCALTGVAFVRNRIKHAPLAPSIDRLDSTKGYTPENCRLVTYMANCAKNQFSEAEFYAMCLAAITYKAGLS